MRIYIFALLLVLLFFTCGKEEEDMIVPGAPNFKIDLNNLDNDLRTPGNFKTFTRPRNKNESTGYSGLLVVSNIYQEGNQVSLSAYDLCCPNEKRKDIMVVPSGDGTATCSKCKKVYDIYMGGYEKSGSSSSRLRLQYYTVSPEANGTVFHIYRR